MDLLIPGRHHLVTRFQASYLDRFFSVGLEGERDTLGRPLSGRPARAVFAVTSADHTATRRNPVPFLQRALALHALGEALAVDLRVYGIDEAGSRPDFASHVLKTILHASGGELELAPENTLVVCATGVGRLYEALGFRVWAAERAEGVAVPLPWELVERIAAAADWKADRSLFDAVHPASRRVFGTYGLDRLIRTVFADPLLGGDGDLTATRDYGSYVRQMDENIAEKWAETEAFVRPGRIGDIGCAVGSWLKRATEDPRFASSDFYGIEITRPLFDICNQRRRNGEFGTPNIWFAQRNAVEGAVFRAGTMSAVHSSSLTHEIESYAGRDALRAFIRQRFEELEPGGVWINRDVVGPEDGSRTVRLELAEGDGENPPTDEVLERTAALASDARALDAVLSALSTASRFSVFARDFRASEGCSLGWRAAAASAPGRRAVELALSDAMEFLLTKDYTDNWQSEMHETFCHWSFSDWKRELEEAGFTVSLRSRAWTNPWILEKRWLGKAFLSEADGRPLAWPPSTAVLVALKEP